MANGFEDRFRHYLRMRALNIGSSSRFTHCLGLMLVKFRYIPSAYCGVMGFVRFLLMELVFLFFLKQVTTAVCSVKD